MYNRKDLLQAHRLMTQRAALALICGEPDSPNQPLRRHNTAIISSVLAGVIVAAVFGVLGLLSPGAVSGLTNPGTLVVDKDAATAYVPCVQSGKSELCPALNYASALLALDTTNVNRVDVSQASLSPYTIGPAVGIANLPQDLPTPGDLVRGPWSVCTENNVSTLIGGRSVGGMSLGVSDAVLATAASPNGSLPGPGGYWLLWNGERLSIQHQVMEHMFPTSDNGIQQVPASWLNAIPQGLDLKAPTISGLGKPVSDPFGKQSQVGQVYSGQLTGGETENFALEANGRLASITEVQADLLEIKLGTKAQPLPPSTPGRSFSSNPVPDDGLPKEVPALAATPPLCEVYPGQGQNPGITVGGTVPAGAVQANATGAGIDYVWLPPGHGALIGTGAAANPGPPGTVTSWFLATGTTRYALANPSVAPVLGYNLATEQTILPASVVQLLPLGPPMDPTKASAPAVG